jgi:hypothetical protein
MKTYKAQIEKPRLVIEYDNDTESPRKWDNLGYFITSESKYTSPDKDERLIKIVIDTGETARNLKEHIELIKESYDDNDDKIIAIYPVTRYEHSGVSYQLGEKHGFDYSNCGFYIVTKESQKVTGTSKGLFEKTIKAELEIYNKWFNGEVYSYILYDRNGEIKDSCGGFYDIEDIQEILPKEWAKENLTDYMVK